MKKMEYIKNNHNNRPICGKCGGYMRSTILYYKNECKIFLQCRTRTCLLELETIINYDNFKKIK